MSDRLNLIFIHGLMSSGQAYKAGLIRRYFPHLLAPDFTGPLTDRMAHLHELLADTAGWTIIGSSLGGLMGTLFTCQRPQKVRRLILLAPALTWPDFANNLPGPVAVPTVIYHGLHDTVVPLEPTRAVAQQLFQNLTFHAVDDDHGLHQTAEAMNWPELIKT